MPAQSKSQARLMNWAKHLKHHPKAKAPEKVKEVAEEMSEKQLSHYSGPIDKDLPEKVAFIASELEKGIEEEREHFKSLKMRRKLTKDHLKDEPKYYSKIEACLNKKAFYAGVGDAIMEISACK
jgi:hypothetical protein